MCITGRSLRGQWQLDTPFRELQVDHPREGNLSVGDVSSGRFHDDGLSTEVDGGGGETASSRSSLRRSCFLKKQAYDERNQGRKNMRRFVDTRKKPSSTPKPGVQLG